jgi:hypothetical protein
MRHFLAYGNSDQASFRMPAVQGAFDYLTVPGTIAAYYPDATAAFVLSSKLNYIVDPRTPLFQGDIDRPKASHYALADWHGQAVRARMGEDQPRGPASFTPGFYTDAVIRGMVDAVIDRQRKYGDRASGIVEQLDRYQRLAEAAQQLAVPEPAITKGKRPSFVLLPYFVTDAEDEWRGVNLAIRAYGQELDQPDTISPVVAVKELTALDQVLGELPAGLSQTVFFWVDRFDEREVGTDSLTRLAQIVAAHSPRLDLVNLYGGFFSICLRYVGLWGFNNGLGYSESRDWPDLPATGAAPARYYMPRLHCFVSPGLGEFITREAPSLACTCSICQGRSVVSLSYHELKQHFALARKSEIELVNARPKDDLSAELIDAADTYLREIVPVLPAGIGRVNPQYLRRWASALNQIT